MTEVVGSSGCLSYCSDFSSTEVVLPGNTLTSWAVML